MSAATETNYDPAHHMVRDEAIPNLTAIQTEEQNLRVTKPMRTSGLMKKLAIARLRFNGAWRQGVCQQNRRDEE